MTKEQKKKQGGGEPMIENEPTVSHTQHNA